MIMRFALLLAAGLLAAPAMAGELVAYNGGDSVRLSDSPCSNEQVLSRIKPQLHAALREASATVQGQPYKACWVAAGATAHLLYEDGDYGVIPMSDFKAPRSA
jgi:hypothetical protein